MAELVETLDEVWVRSSTVLRWACPVPFFGDISTARVATVGLNPSNREFVDATGVPLGSSDSRLPTLSSLGRDSWAEVDGAQVREVFSSCRAYFSRNPYDGWFRVLERVLRYMPATYYGSAPSACHVDLIPFATHRKWSDLSPFERLELLNGAKNGVAQLLSASSLKVLILNGASVVENFSAATGIGLKASAQREWTLARRTGRDVPGFGFRGEMTGTGDVDFGRRVLVLGYNHNLQSSFGVTRRAQEGIGMWLAEEVQQWKG